MVGSFRVRGVWEWTAPVAAHGAEIVRGGASQGSQGYIASISNTLAGAEATMRLVGECASRMKTTDEEAHIRLTAASTAAIPITVRRKYMSTVGRQEWIVNSTAAKWEVERTAIIVLDMWNTHWCKSDVTRIRENAL